MNTKPEALRLADAIQSGWLENVDPYKADIDMLQNELRRLHALNAELMEALEAIDALNIVAFEGKWHALALECQEMAFKAVYKARRTK